MTKISDFSALEFNELCRFVCTQFRTTSVQEVDIETFSFAVYWQLCQIFDRKIKINNDSESCAQYWQEQIQILIDGISEEQFNVSMIINRIINEYPDTTRPTDCSQLKLVLN